MLQHVTSYTEYKHETDKTEAMIIIVEFPHDTYHLTLLIKYETII